MIQLPSSLQVLLYSYRLINKSSRFKAKCSFTLFEIEIIWPRRFFHRMSDVFVHVHLSNHVHWWRQHHPDNQMVNSSSRGFLYLEHLHKYFSDKHHPLFLLTYYPQGVKTDCVIIPIIYLFMIFLHYQLI
jgi:hypothetical protein